MNNNIIYKKKYPCVELSADLNSCETNRPIPPFEKIFERTRKDRPKIVRHERENMVWKFLQLAIEISEQYELDTVIQRFKDRISVSYSFDCGGAMQGLGKVFGMADEVAFSRIFVDLI